MYPNYTIILDFMALHLCIIKSAFRCNDSISNNVCIHDVMNECMGIRKCIKVENVIYYDNNVKTVKKFKQMINM